MAIEIRTTKDISVEGIKCVVYGQSGVGKTVLLSTAPNILVISAEKGLLSLTNQNIPFIEVRSLEDVNDTYRFVSESKEAEQFETVGIDSISELAEVCLLQVKSRLIRESETGKIDVRQAYGKYAESVGIMIRRFRNLPRINVVMVAKEKRIYESDDSDAYTNEPYLPGKVLPFNVPYLVDELFCMRMDRKNVRYLQTQIERRYIAKDRSGRLDAKEPPNLSGIFAKIRGQSNSNKGKLND